MLAAQVRQKLFDVRLSAIGQSRRITGLVERRSEQQVRGRGRCPQLSESLVKLRTPTVTAKLENLLVAHSHQRTAEGSDGRDIIQRIHQCGEKHDEVANLAGFEKSPAAAHQKRNAEAIESALEWFHGTHRSHQDRDV